MKSPCNTSCYVETETNTCGECGRTLTEIELWSTFSDEQRKEISKQLKERKSER